MPGFLKVLEEILIQLLTLVSFFGKYGVLDALVIELFRSGPITVICGPNALLRFRCDLKVVLSTLRDTFDLLLQGLLHPL